MLSPASILLTLAGASHGAERFRGPRAQPIIDLIATFPAPKRVSLEDAPSALALASTPLLAGILPSEDMLSFWEVSSMPAEARHRCEQQHQNFIKWFDGLADQFQLQISDSIVLPRGTDRTVLSWSEVREWVTSVTLFTVGYTLVRNEGAVVLAFIATDGTRNFTPGPDFDGCAHNH